MKVELGLLAVGVGLLFPVQAQLDATRGEPLHLIETLPPIRLLPALAVGHRESMADLLEIRATNFLMKRLDPSVTFSDAYRDHMWKMYDAILELDPHNSDAAWRGGLYMGAVGNRPDDAIALLKRGLGEPFVFQGTEHPARQGVHPAHPNRWRLFHEQAATYFLMHANRTFGAERQAFVRKAGRLWIQAHEAGAPAAIGLGQIGAMLSQRVISRREALRHEMLIWSYRASSAGTEATRDQATRRLSEAQAGFLQTELQRAVAVLRKRGQPPRRLEDIKQGFPQANLVDPLGGKFYLRRGRVLAPRFEALRLRRRLQNRFEAWVRERPGHTPTAADLGLEEGRLPAYLQLEITAAGVSITPGEPKP